MKIIAVLAIVFCMNSSFAETFKGHAMSYPHGACSIDIEMDGSYMDVKVRYQLDLGLRTLSNVASGFSTRARPEGEVIFRGERSRLHVDFYRGAPSRFEVFQNDTYVQKHLICNLD
jgi:hypothetical protein